MQSYSYRWGRGGRTETWCHSAVGIINLGKGGICKIVSLCRDFVIRSPSSSSLAVRPGTGFLVYMYTLFFTARCSWAGVLKQPKQLGGLFPFSCRKISRARENAL